ncbi:MULTISPECIES: L-lactate dehydrogenase [Staphylococcus]|uniref:L-lactate dehydrogenase n=1 Tax=Staphylococcus ureilyticus TaxID=94138 RepID=A0AB34AK05_STAUR|nr:MULTISPECIES: L-lactate dehydrogenase [Staphylococcus]AVL77950.1 L-lactate dehydrogenase [Staphylococcus cohnii]KKD21367.1 lactate dehydrogenase [Staphylococcus cohnii subsp. cohnii]KKD23147.1 lactate dehydrogenase [Staphylococcus cohnii subsp. cohnii]MBL0375737.1 L-lactate dehydrogenase [Staphylococcus sp. S75]MBL0383516.1 L-lactate dehydrogenase [Staphylococcus sp. S59]
MKIEKGNKVVLIGDGAVGSSYAFAVVAQGLADELVIIDLDEAKVKGDVADLNHSAPYGDSPVKVKAGSYEDCSNADLIVITAGAAQKPGETRLDLVEKNTKIFKDIVTKIMSTGFNGIFLIATNPVDVLSYVTQKVSGLPKAQVIGSGTILDTARFKFELAQEFGVSPWSVDAQIIGEHGDSELAIWSQANIAGQPLYNLLNDNPDKQHRIDEIFTNTRDAAYEIIQSKGATYYGIAMGLVRITQAILKNQNVVLPVSSYLEGEYKQEDVYIGVPTLINRNGAVKVYETQLNSEESEKFENSAIILKDMQNKIKQLIA